MYTITFSNGDFIEAESHDFDARMPNIMIVFTKNSIFYINLSKYENASFSIEDFEASKKEKKGELSNV